MPKISSNFIPRAQKVFNDNILDSKMLNRIYTSAKENPARFAGQMALWSALTKDALGCYYYVTQSLDNDRIPEDKRSFVAAIDLMNGILNIGLQFTVGHWLDKKSPEFFDSLIGKKLKEVDTRKIAKKIEETIKKVKPEKNISFEQIDHFLRNKTLGPEGKTSKWLKVGFNAAVMLLATQVFTKRVIVPFLSTPMASWYKENVMDKNKKELIYDRVSYQRANVNSKTAIANNKLDRTPFSKVATR